MNIKPLLSCPYGYISGGSSLYRHGGSLLHYLLRWGVSWGRRNWSLEGWIYRMYAHDDMGYNTPLCRTSNHGGLY